MNTYPAPDSFDEQVLNLLKSGKRLSVLDTIRDFGIPSLRECVYRLRKAGYPIVDEWKPCVGDQHRQNRYKRYFIETQSNTKSEGGF